MRVTFIHADGKGRTEAEAERVAFDHARRTGHAIPDDVRVAAGFRRRSGWDVRITDYRDAERGPALTVAVDDDDTVYLR